MKQEMLIKKLSVEINRNNGKAYFVGGYVRDKLLGIDNKDIDIEVHGIEVQKLEEILSSIDVFDKYGNSFAIYSFKNSSIDIALPRKEKKIGIRHQDFKVEIDPFLGTYKASKRRDFTINSLMQDLDNTSIIDHFNGINDLKHGIIRHIDDISFIEDPLRVLRACQFAARFDFKIADETMELCKKIDISFLSKERVLEELKKALLKSQKPSIFFDQLKQMNHLNHWFKEIADLEIIDQDPLYHPEGNVYIHTMAALDQGVKYRDKVSDPFLFMLAILCHDLGKILVTSKKGERIHAYDHENAGLPLVDNFISRLSNDKFLKKYVLNMTRLHMKPNVLAKNNSKEKSTNRLFDEAVAPLDLIYLSKCDKPTEENRDEYLFDRLEKYNELIKKPEVKGIDLINNGLIPDKHFKEYLLFAHKLHLSGIDKQEALKQTLTYAKKNKSQHQ